MNDISLEKMQDVLNSDEFLRRGTDPLNQIEGIGRAAIGFGVHDEFGHFVSLSSTLDTISERINPDNDVNDMIGKLADLKERVGLHTERRYAGTGELVVQDGIVSDGIDNQEYITLTAELGHILENDAGLFDRLKAAGLENHGDIAPLGDAAANVVKSVGISDSADNFDYLVDGISYTASVEAAISELKIMEKAQAPDVIADAAPSEDLVAGSVPVVGIKP